MRSLVAKWSAENKLQVDWAQVDKLFRDADKNPKNGWVNMRELRPFLSDKARMLAINKGKAPGGGGSGNDDKKPDNDDSKTDNGGNTLAAAFAKALSGGKSLNLSKFKLVVYNFATPNKLPIDWAKIPRLFRAADKSPKNGLVTL